jgi:hypothetical protein
MIVTRFLEKYGEFHMQMLVADGRAVVFYEKMSFIRAGKTRPPTEKGA